MVIYRCIVVDKNRQLLYEKQADILKGLAHPLRVAILDFLRDGPQCVCYIAEHIGSERSNISRHLAIMVNAGVLKSHKQGLNVIYELKMPCVLKFFSCLSACIKQQGKETEKLLKVI